METLTREGNESWRKKEVTEGKKEVRMDGRNKSTGREKGTKKRKRKNRERRKGRREGGRSLFCGKTSWVATVTGSSALEIKKGGIKSLK